MTNFWFENSERNLFAKSENKTDFDAAREEWTVTGRVIDNYEDMDFDEDPPDVSCELCNHEQIRWQFEIRNENNKNVMLVGSSCIEKFNINYFKNGRLLSPEDRKSLLDKQVRDIIENNKYEAGLDALRSLYKANKEERDKITRLGRIFKRIKKLEPCMAVDTSRMFEEAGIEFQPSWFKIHLRDDYSKQSISEMDNESFNCLKPFLSKQQIEVCRKLRGRNNKCLM